MTVQAVSLRRALRESDVRPMAIGGRAESGIFILAAKTFRDAKPCLERMDRPRIWFRRFEVRP